MSVFKCRTIFSVQNTRNDCLQAMSAINSNGLLKSEVTGKNASNHGNRPKLSKSYVHAAGNEPLLGIPIGDIVNNASVESPDKVGFVFPFQNVRKTFGEFKREVDQLAVALLDLGLEKGDKIGLWGPNSYEWLLTFYASATAGLVVVNINPAFQAFETEYNLKKAECRAVVVGEAFKTQDYYKLLCDISPKIPESTPGNLHSDKVPDLRIVIVMGIQTLPGSYNFNEVLKRGKDGKMDKLMKNQKSVKFDDPVNIQFTSGTTGKPKGAMLTHHNLVNNAHVLGKRLNLPERKLILCCQVPLFHCFGCVCGSILTILYQGTLVMPSATFSSEQTLEAIHKERCTVVYGTPTMYVDILRNSSHKYFDFSSVEIIVSGGSTYSEKVMKNIKKHTKVKHVVNGYGCTENSPAVFFTGEDKDYAKDAPESVSDPGGYLLQHMEAKIIDNDGHVVPVNTDGELCTRGHMVFLGYYKSPEKTKEVVENTGWYHTGDLARVCENGFLTVTGRIKDIIIRGGENVYPSEVEDFLYTHPDISEVNVIGVPDLRMGEEVCAWIMLKQGATLREQDIKDYCKGKISHFKIPRYIMFVDNFPKTASGKVKKFKMREISINNLKTKNQNNFIQ